MSYKAKDMWPFSCRGNFSVIVKQKANLTCSAGGRCKENVGKYVLLALGDCKALVDAGENQLEKLRFI